MGLVLFVVLTNYTVKAQFGLSITQCTTIEQVEALIDTVFLEGISPAQIKNISFTGDPGAVGYFTGGYIFGFQVPQGIVLSSGFTGDLDQSNDCGSFESGNTSGGSDPDLVLAGGTSINDACVIEFDFKPAGDSVKFNYVFGSEEYHEWVSPLFADVFGFFLSGPGINGNYSNNGINIAEVPGTHNPVSIGTVNCGDQDNSCTPPPGSGPGCEFLYDNTDVTQGSFNQCTMDAYTVPFVADNGVESCEWFHIKLAIGDAGDAAYDSGVFLEKGSFDPGNVECNTDFTHPTVDSLLYESCNNHEAVLYFSIGSLRNDPYILPFTIEGSATRGVDYMIITTHPGDTIYIDEGSLVDSIRIRTFYNPEVEGLEDVRVKFNPVMCGFGAPDTAIVWISDLPAMPDTNLMFTSYCQETATLDFANNLGGVPPYSYDWYTVSKTTPTIDYKPNGDNLFYFPCIVTDTCGQARSDTAFLIVPDLVASAGPDKTMCNVDSVQIEGSSPGAQIFFWESDPPNEPSLQGKEYQDTAWVFPTVATDYKLRVSDNCTNSDTDTVLVSLDEAVANAGENQVICYSESVTLSANGGTGYQWEWTSVPPDPTIGGQINDQTITVSPTATATVYTVSVTNDCDKTAEADVQVEVIPLPNADAGANSSVCFGQEFQLNASGGTQYLWTSDPVDPTLSVNGQDTLPNPIVNPPSQEPYKYYVQVWDQCTNSDSMTLMVDPVPSLSVAADNEILCFGESATLSVTGNANYTWTADPTDPSLAGQENNQIITVTPQEPTTYTLVGVVAGFNCPATIVQEIDVKPELQSTFDLQADETCQGKSFSVLYNGNASVSANYTWDFDGGQIITGSGGGPVDVSWDTEGLKTIILSVEEDGCFSDVSSMTVNVLRAPVSAFDSNLQEDCIPFDVSFNNTSSNQSSNVSYLWTFGTGESSTSESPSFTYDQPGEYTVTLVVTNDEKCSNTFTQINYIKANETPSADFEPVPPETVLEQPTVNFTNNSTSSDNLSYDWDFGDGNTSSDQSPSNTYGAVGAYTVKLLVTTANGCEHETEKEVVVHPDFAVHAPNAFTPNGDGLNDVFDVKGVGIKVYLLQIYSRWGDLMYESNNLEDQWDGKFNGELVPDGTYVYTINYKSMLDKDYVKKGTVTVTR